LVYNLGVIGCGNIWNMRHKPSLQNLQDLFKVKIVCDAREEAAKKAAEEMKCNYTVDWRAVVERKDIEAISLLTPPFVRLEPIKEICREGKALYCEKPLALNISEAKEIRDLVNKSGIPFVTEFIRRHFKTTQKMMELFRDELGDPAIIWCVTGPWGWITGGWENWMVDQQRSGGQMLDLGSHFVDFTRFIFKTDATRVFGYGKRLVNKEFPQNDMETLSIEFGDSKFAEIIMCRTKQGIRRPGERPKRIVTGPETETPLFTIVTSENNVLYTSFTDLVYYVNDERREWKPEPRELSFWEVGAEIYRLFYKQIETGEYQYPAATVEDSYKAVEIIWVGKESMEKDVKINLPL